MRFIYHVIMYEYFQLATLGVPATLKANLAFVSQVPFSLTFVGVKCK